VGIGAGGGRAGRKAAAPAPWWWNYNVSPTPEWSARSHAPLALAEQCGGPVFVGVPKRTDVAVLRDFGIVVVEDVGDVEQVE